MLCIYKSDIFREWGAQGFPTPEMIEFPLPGFLEPHIEIELCVYIYIMIPLFPLIIYM